MDQPVIERASRPTPGTLPEISIAPMMDWTDRHCRYLLRLIAPHALLYTEMVTTGALLFGDRDRHLRFNPEEHPIAVQLGGNDPAALAECAKIAEGYGYDQINLNCGCPSDRVQNGAFGACLMKEPARVADCVAAMQAAVKIPVTVKSRIGVDDCNDLPFLLDFVGRVRAAGCRTFVIHARKAWLQGLSPKENREIPPLRYDIAAAVKETWPELRVILNGGITTLEQVKTLTAPGAPFDGLMIGREAYQNPYFLASIEAELFDFAAPDRFSLVEAMVPYIERQNRDHGVPVKSVTRHMLGLFAGHHGGKAWRRHLSTEAFRPGAEAGKLLHDGLNMVKNSHKFADAA